MKFFNFLFKDKTLKNENLNDSESVKQKIESAIRVCERDLKSEKNKIVELENTAKKLIADIFFVPSEYWYDEIKFLSEIKKHPENKDIDASVISKTDRLLSEYFQQIELSKSRIDFLSILSEKYKKLSVRVEKTIHKTLMLKNKNEYFKAIKKYKGKLNTVTESTEDLHTFYEESVHFKTIQQEIREIEEDFDVQKEVDEYINQITLKFGEDTDTVQTEILRDEIDKPEKELKDTKKDDD